MLIAVDQEGGTVQRLKGEGFSSIPPARQQAEMPEGELRNAAREWGAELSSAGIHYDLAPVADTVPASKRASNAPIGKLERDYGENPQAAARSVVEFIEGMQDAGLVTSIKHFPGLGEVTTNTDFGSAQDVDIDRNSDGLEVFRAGINAGASSVMVSSAVFTKIDPDNEGVFSSVVMEEMLRGDFGFDGVIIADDLGAAKAVSGVSPADRAVRFFEAGGDLLINANPALMGQMVDATVARASAEAEFAVKTTESAARVLGLKAEAGLLDCQ